jgi:hypothetical protein
MSAITLQFVTTKSLLSGTIRLYERAWMSHVDSVMADGRLLGAQNVGGVQIREPNYEQFSRAERVSIPVTDKQEELYWDFLREQIGKPYDTLAIVAFALDRDWRSPDAWFCDELVAAGLEHAGLVHKLAPQINRVNVRDLYLVVSAIAPVNS